MLYLAAEKGYDVYAVDFSTEAIKSAKKLAENKNVKVNFIQEDIFKLEEFYKNYFDYVYDYVTYCAIDPVRRKEYSRVLAKFLKAGGKLVALLFPVEKREGGPPFAINTDEFYNIFSQHFKLEFSSKVINSIIPRKGREVLQIYIKKEKHDADKS